LSHIFQPLFPDSIKMQSSENIKSLQNQKKSELVYDSWAMQSRKRICFYFLFPKSSFVAALPSFFRAEK